MTFIVSELEIPNDLKSHINSFLVVCGSFSVSSDGKNPYSSNYSSIGGSVSLENSNLNDLSIKDKQIAKAVLSAQSNYDFMVHMYIIGEMDAPTFHDKKTEMLSRTSKIIVGIYNKEIK